MLKQLSKVMFKKGRKRIRSIVGKIDSWVDELKTGIDECEIEIKQQEDIMNHALNEINILEDEIDTANNLIGFLNNAKTGPE